MNDQKKMPPGGSPAALNGTKIYGEHPDYTMNGNGFQAPNHGSFDNDISDIISLSDAAHVAPAPTQAEQEADAIPVYKFKPRSLAELLAMPPKEWIIDQVLGAGDLAMLYGAPGSGKTFVVVDAIFSACLGTQWAMRFDIPRPLNVAYCAGEGVSGLPSRFGAAAQHHGVDDPLKFPNFTFYEVTPALYYDDSARNDIESIERFATEWKQRQDSGDAQPLDILVIDTLHSATAGADENSAQDMGRVLELCRKTARVLGCAVILVHHSNKAGTGERGSSAMRGAMDCMIEVKTCGNKYVLECAKLKDGERWKNQTFSLATMGESVRVWWDEPSTTSDSDFAPSQEVLKLLKNSPSTKFTARQLAEPLGMTTNAAINVLKRLVDKGEIKSELHLAEKPPSNRNPWVYFISGPS